MFRARATRHLHRPQVEMALALGLSATGASNLLGRPLPAALASELNQEALLLAETCRRASTANLSDQGEKSGIG